VGNQYPGEVRLGEPFLEPIPEPSVLRLTSTRKQHNVTPHSFYAYWDAHTI
jgi:hypothetical protein